MVSLSGAIKLFFKGQTERVTFFLLLVHVGGIVYQEVHLCSRCLESGALLIVVIPAREAHSCSEYQFFLHHSLNGTYEVSASTAASSAIWGRKAWTWRFQGMRDSHLMRAFLVKLSVNPRYHGFPVTHSQAESSPPEDVPYRQAFFAVTDFDILVPATSRVMQKQHFSSLAVWTSSSPAVRLSLSSHL